MRRVLRASLISYLFIIIGFSTSFGFAKNLFPLIPIEARSNGKLGVVVKSLKTNQTIFEFNPNLLFVPASNMKVIISVAALSLLDKDFRFKTIFYSGGETSYGVLHGGLYLKGFGDPTLETEDLAFAAEQIRMMGVREIRGGIVVDDSYFDRVRYGRGWKDKWKGDAFSPPIGALTLNHNIFKIHVYPTKIGGAPSVALEPSGTYVKIINNAVTSNKKGGLSAHWIDGQNTIVIRGRIHPRRSSQSFELAVGKPDLYAGGVIKKKLEERGIKVSGAVTQGQVPDWARTFYIHHSSPLPLVVNEYNKESVNVIGENILKTLGAYFQGTPGSWDKGAQVISDFLRRIGITDQFRIVDGSGLSNLNRVTPETLTDILQHAYTDKLIGRDFINSLPIAGVDGTLKKRFQSSRLEGRVLAKTGFLDNVRALSGYAYTNSGDVLVFSILANGLGWKAKEFQNNLLMELIDCCNGSSYKGN